MENHHCSLENSLLLWPYSMAISNHQGRIFQLSNYPNIINYPIIQLSNNTYIIHPIILQLYDPIHHESKTGMNLLSTSSMLYTPKAVLGAPVGRHPWRHATGLVLMRHRPERPTLEMWILYGEFSWGFRIFLGN